MIAAFLQRLTHKTTEKLPPLDENLAIGALLVRLARSDAHYAVEEIALIDKLIADHMKIGPIEAAKTRATCEKLAADAPETEVFTRMVQERVSHENRIAVLEALWRVSIADGRLRPEEEAFLKDAAASLGLSELEVTRVSAEHRL